MDPKRRIGMGVAIIAVALGAGHLVQGRKTAPVADDAVADAAIDPTSVATVSGAPEPTLTGAGLPPDLPPEDAPPLPRMADLGPDLDGDAARAPALVPTPPADEPLLAVTDRGADVPSGLPRAATEPLRLAAAETTLPAVDLTPVLPVPEPAPLAAATPAAEDSCAPTLDALADDDVMIGLTLVAPCRPNERVVIRHGGLAVTGQTTDTGAMFLSIPALDPKGEVMVLFGDGELIEASVPMPEVAALRRFGVQWLADDAFQVHAFEDGSDYSGAGHVWQGAPRGAEGRTSGGYLTLVGDPLAKLPMLAQIYTYPAGQDTVPLSVEAEVTEATCAREIQGQTVLSENGRATLSDLTLAMPDCDAVGDFLVLNNPVAGLKLALAE